jgi:myo-inositol-1(or 4)-monophosphatase
MTAIDFQAFLDELATVSGETVLPFFRTALSIDNKRGPGGFDPVTAADHAAETAMRTLIRRSFPSHGIIGEEYGRSVQMRNMSGCSIRSMEPSLSFPACRHGAR